MEKAEIKTTIERYLISVDNVWRSLQQGDIDGARIATKDAARWHADLVALVGPNGPRFEYVGNLIVGLKPDAVGNGKPQTGTTDPQRKHTRDFGNFHVSRAAIPGTVSLVFVRRHEHQPQSGNVIPERIIVADIHKENRDGRSVNRFLVMSYEPGERPRVLYSGDSYVNMSKTEKIVYRMVKTDLKETARRYASRKRARAAKKAEPTI